jgi:hypothetical protein
MEYGERNTCELSTVAFESIRKGHALKTELVHEEIGDLVLTGACPTTQ